MNNICYNIICKITDYLQIDEKSQLQRVHRIYDLPINYQEQFTNNLINNTNKIINNLKDIVEYFNFIELNDLKFLEVTSYQSYIFKVTSKYNKMKGCLENTQIYPYIDNRKIKCFNEIRELINNNENITINHKYNSLHHMYTILIKYCLIYEKDHSLGLDDSSDSDSDSDDSEIDDLYC